MAAPILTTKLYIPPVRPELVPRPRLIERLNAGLRAPCKLALVSAPPGFGKTTLLSAWIRDRAPHLRAAWLSLNKEDNDPARFLAYVIAALQTLDAGLGHNVLDALQSPRPPATDELVTALINEMGALPDALVLILDDYHLITAQPIHTAVAFLLDHLPGNMRLVIATRSDPPLPIARLRARGQLIELRQSDLRFTLDEAIEFFDKVMPAALAADHVAALTFRAEGWIAGLQMATLALQARPSAPDQDISGFVAAFTGSQHYILDYLMEEVFQRQSENVCAFLLQTSILDQLCGALCDAVTSPLGEEPGSSQAMLEYLDHANLFVLPLDDHQRWYRYHRLFADLLQKRLRQAHADRVPALHRRASEWHEQNGYPAQAIEHALSAHAFDRAAQLLEQIAPATLMQSENITFMNWVDRLPKELVCARPELGIFHAWALVISGRPLDDVASRLNSIDTRSSVMAGKVALIQAYIASLQGRVSVTAELVRQALEQLPEDESFMRINAAWLLSNLYVTTGDFPAAMRAFDELARRSLQAGHVMIAVGAWSHLAEVHLRLAQTREAQTAYGKALDIAADARGQRLPVAGEALLGLGDVRRELNDLESALRYTLEGIELAQRWRWVTAALGYVTLARIRQAQGNSQDAEQAIQAARQLAAQYDTTDMGIIGVAFYQAQLWIEQGRLEAAWQWARERGLASAPCTGAPVHGAPVHGALDPTELDRQDDFISYHLRKYEYLVLARLWLAQNRPDQAALVLEPVLIRMEQQRRTRLLIETLMLKALALQAQGDAAQAIAALERALTLAEPGGYIRLFADEGEPLRLLISDFRFWIGKQSRQAKKLVEYVDKLLTAFAPAARVPPSEIRNPQSKILEPLSERELEVLRLLAADLSNPEIAERLYLAVNTVRSHVKSIYGKLDVHSRYEAAIKAQDLRLLSGRAKD